MLDRHEHLLETSNELSHPIQRHLSSVILLSLPEDIDRLSYQDWHAFTEFGEGREYDIHGLEGEAASCLRDEEEIETSRALARLYGAVPAA
jgi:hypothetical protein